MKNKSLNEAILLYLLTYQNAVELLRIEHYYKTGIYGNFINIHFGIRSKILLFLHLLVSPFRILFLFVFFTGKLIFALAVLFFRNRKKFNDKELFLLFNTLIIEKSKGADLFARSKSWLLAPYYKKRVELYDKNQYTVYDFIKIADIVFAYKCAVFSFFPLWRKYCYELTIYHYCSFDFFLVYKSLEHIPSDVTIFFSTQIDRWSLLFDRSKQVNKILIQHGIEEPSAFWRCRFSHVDTVYAISEKEAPNLIHACFRIPPQNIYYVRPTLKLTDMNSKYKMNIMIISYSASYFVQECELIQSLSNLKVGIYVKLHPTLKGNVFSALLKQYSFRIIEDQTFPDVDIIVSYNSTLAKEYEQLGKKILYHTEMGVDAVIEKIRKLKNEN